MYYIPGGGAVTIDDWLQVPRTIIATKNDKAMVPALQKQLWAGFEHEMVWIDAGHSPFMAMPGYLADVVIDGVQRSNR